jgi:hypothetical protein
MKNKEVFVPLVGEFSNVGDVMHRNELLQWLTPVGKLHIYIGKAPKDFVKSLILPDDAILYTSFFSWLLKLIFARVNCTIFVFNSGEVTLRARRLFLELLLLPFILLVKLKGGKIFRIGIACMSNIKINLFWLWKLLFKTTDKIFWRTKKSQELFQIGEIIPDLAFAPPLVEAKSINPTYPNNEFLVISMRHDRPYPSDEWFSKIKEFANQKGLKIVVVSQVRKDNHRTEEIASKLGVQAIIWNQNVNHLHQEEVVRGYYNRALITISDRLHVLIAAYTQGSIPCCILTSQADKVQDHFDAIGLFNVVMRTGDGTDILNFLELQLARKEDFNKKLLEAQENLLLAKLDLFKEING